MTGVLIQSIFSSIILLALGIFVYLNNTKSQRNISFSLLALSAFWWLSFFTVAYLVNEKSKSEVFLKIGYIGVIFIVITAYHFIAAFLRKNSEKKFVVLSYLIGLIFTFLLLFTNLFVKGVSLFYWGYYPMAGILHPIYMAFLCILVLRFICLLFKNYKNKEFDNLERNRAKYVLLAMTTFSFAAIDFLPNYNLNIYPLGFIFVLLYSGLITYAIVRHQLMEIEVVIKKTLVYSVLISVVTVAYFVIVYLLERFFSVMIGYQSILPTIGMIILFSIMFTPLKNRIQRSIDRSFFRGTIDQIEQEKALLEDELQKSERLKMMSTLAAGLAHEIKNPLTSIKTFVEYVDEKYHDPKFRENFKNILPKEIDKISNIINQLLDYSKVDRVSLKSSNIHGILDYVLGLYNNEFIKNHITVEKFYNAKGPYVMCDENQIKQAFINIILNGMEAMPSGGNLTVETANIDSMLTITIKDTGTGIPKEKLKHIFEPFYTTKEKGTGLGLFIVYRIILNNKGRIEIDSDIGKGTIVRLKFEGVDVVR